MKIGYARVSKFDQNMDLQMDALEKAGCIRIFYDNISGAKDVRPGLTNLNNALREGDIFIVWRLDRLGRSLKQLISIANDLEYRGVGLKSLSESIDTTTPGGKLIFHVFGALAEFERNIIKERTKAGLTAARTRGKVGGRPKKIDTNIILAIKHLHEKSELPIKDICNMYGISKPTLYRYLKVSL